MKKKIIYLDNSATTAVYHRAVRAMNEVFLKNYGNPSSMHEMGEKAGKILDEARKKLALEIGAKESEIIFTSGASEANNFALFGIAENPKKKKIVISSIEHASVYEPAKFLEKKGFHVAEIPVSMEGLIDLNALEKEIDNECAIVSIMHANNEIGVLQDLRKIGEMCQRKKVLFHTDAVQSYGKERINVKEMGIDLLSASSHKIGGPKGIGFLYAKNGIKINPMILGGGQEAGRRGGTENVSGAVGFAAALDITKKSDKDKTKKLRDYFMEELEKIGGKINGSRKKRLWNNVHVSFPIDAEMLVLRLSQKGIMCSTQSACSEKREKESRTLSAIGLDENEKKGSVRFTLNESTSRKDINFVVEEIKKFLNNRAGN